MEVISSSSNAPDTPGSYRITVPPPLPSARQQQLNKQQQLAKLKLAKATFDDIKGLLTICRLG